MRGLLRQGPMKEKGLLERPYKRGTRLIREKGLFGCHGK